jgi:hypothetical protein
MCVTCMHAHHILEKMLLHCLIAVSLLLLLLLLHTCVGPGRRAECLRSGCCYV